MKFSIIFGYLFVAYFAAAHAKSAPVRQTSCKDSISSAEMTIFLNEAKDKHDVNYNRGEHIRYDLYTSSNIHKPQVLRTADADALRNSNFNPNWPVRIFIQGWTGRSTSCASEIIKDAFLSTGKLNVILVDWSDIALNMDFQWVEKQFPNLGYDIADFILFLQKETNLQLKNVNLIGHSSGCHIAAIIGKILNDEKLGAIVALDPSNLKSKDLPPDYYLSAKDALYVEVTYTDTSSLTENRLILGQATFFPNWGQDQPHCATATQSQIFNECDNFAAVHYFAQSIRRPNLFAAVKCPTVSSVFENFDCRCSSMGDTCSADVYMGGEPLQPKSGLFYLSTEPYAPYGLAKVVIHKRDKPSTEIPITMFS